MVAALGVSAERGTRRRLSVLRGNVFLSPVTTRHQKIVSFVIILPFSLAYYEVLSALMFAAVCEHIFLNVLLTTELSALNAMFQVYFAT